MAETDLIAAAQAGDELAFRRLVEPLLVELKAHCYRMAGTLHEADDLLQESLLRAWRAMPGFERRSSLRTWMYRVTTTACLDALDKQRRRVLPTALGPAFDPETAFAGGEAAPPSQPSGEVEWLQPFPDLGGGWVESPEARLTARESVSLAFLTVLQQLPARQRAVLLLRDVLGWAAAECGELLGMSVAAVNSSLQRARDALAERPRTARPRAPEGDEQTASLLRRYVRAWEQADVDQLVTLLHEDAVLSMPPYLQWFAGRAAIVGSMRAMVLTPEARGCYRLLPTHASGEPAFAAYQLDEGGVHRFAAIHVVRVAGGAIEEICAFLDPSLSAPFGVPASLPPLS